MKTRTGLEGGIRTNEVIKGTRSGFIKRKNYWKDDACISTRIVIETRTELGREGLGEMRTG